MSTLRYIKNFLMDRDVASITPTARRAVRRISSNIDLAQANVVVEYGPGGGIFTEYLLGQLGPNAKLIAIERNTNFFNLLNAKFSDSRLILVNDSAENVADILYRLGVGLADAVISGIPLTFLSAEDKTRLIENTRDILRENGNLVIYQFISQRFSRNWDLRGLLSLYFENIQVSQELLNIPPLCVYVGQARRNAMSERVEPAKIQASAQL